MTLHLKAALDTARTSRFAAILLVAIVLGWSARAVLVLAKPMTVEAVLTPLNDSTDYDHLANSLLDGRGFSAPTGEPTAFRPPLYPVFLSGVYGVAGRTNLVAVGLVHCLLEVLAIGLMIALARRALGTARGAPLPALALLPAAIYAVYPAFILQTNQLLTEVLSRLQLLAFLLVTVDLLREPTRRRAVISGLLFGLFVLNKSALLGCAPFLALAVFAAANTTRARAALLALICGLAAAAPVLPWTLRNALASERFVPVSTNFPITFAHGLTKFSYYTNEWYGGTRELLEVPEDYRNLTQLRNYRGIREEIELGAPWQEKANRFVVQNQGFFTILTIRKALHFWGPFVSNKSRLQEAVAVLTMGPVLLLGWIGLCRAITIGGGARRAALLFLAIALPLTLPYAISQPDVRYRLSLIDPMWMIAVLWAFSPKLCS